MQPTQTCSCDRVDLLVASTLIKDATASRNITFRPEAKYVRSYIIYNHVLFKVALYVILWLNLSMTLFEKPTITSISLPYWSTMTVEVLCLMFFTTRLIHCAHFQYPGDFWRDPKNLTVLCTVILTLTDMMCYCVWVNLCSPGVAVLAVRWSRPLRPLFLVNVTEGRQLRKAFRNIRRTLPDMLYVLVLFFGNIALFALLCLKLFSDRGLSYPDGRPYFQNYWECLWDLYVLVTTANNPDVKMPAYDANNWYALVFVVYIMINLYVMMNIVLAVIYNDYKKHLKNEVRTTVRHKHELLGQAFDILKICNSGQHDYVTRDTFHDVMRVHSPDISTIHIDFLLTVLDTRGDNMLERRDFLKLSDVLTVKVEVTKDEGTLFDRRCPSCYSSKINEYCKMAIRTRYFRWIFDVMTVVNAVCIGLSYDSAEWYFLSAFTLEIILLLYTQGPYIYFTTAWNVFDFVVILAALAVTIVGSALQEVGTVGVKSLDVLMVLRILRLIRITSAIPRFKIVLTTIVNIGPSIATYGCIIFVVFYVYAIIGMEIFHDRVHYYGYNTTNSSELHCGNPALEGSKFATNRYCSNNFNSVLHSMVLLFDLLVVNQWHVLAEGYVLVTHKAARLYFISFHIINVTILLNIFTAFVLEAFILEYTMSRGQLEGVVERRIKDLGLGVGQTYKACVGVKPDRLQLVDNMEETGETDTEITVTTHTHTQNNNPDTPARETGGNKNNVPATQLEDKPPTDTHTNTDPGLRFRLKKTGRKRMEVLLQLMFEKDLQEDDQSLACSHSNGLDTININMFNQSEESV